MIQPVILEKLEELPESLQTEVLHFIEFLIEKHAKNSTEEKQTNKLRVAGTMKGMFVLPASFAFHLINAYLNCAIARVNSG